jgi:phosphoribosyl-AMP cyclohydrolase
MTIDSLKYDEKGLIPAVVQDADNGDVLMVGYMNEAAVRQTLDTGKVTFWSRSRKKFWIKGETSGNFQLLKGLYIDCDRDCILVKVEQIGPACHEGYRSCFFREVTDSEAEPRLVAERMKSPEEIYGQKT